jgi:glycosyltransferase involved in cell wall biosynthesis
MPLPSMPRVSVVVPLYQKGRYVQRALESVFRQTVNDFELIVVDDGSTDDGPSILRGIEDARLLVHRQDRQGVSVARNRGISLARAPWVAFLDADDEWLPGFLESTLRTAETCPGVSAVFSNLWDYPTRRPLLSGVDRQGPLVRDYFATLVSNDGIGMSSSSVVVSKAHLTTCGAFSVDVRHYEDMDLWARLAWTGEVGFCEEPLAIYHSEVPDSASKSVREGIRPYPAVLRTYEEWTAEQKIPARLRESSRRYANWFLAWNVMELAHQGLREEARQRLNSTEWRDHDNPYLWKARVWTWLPTAVLRIGRRVRRELRPGPRDL